MFPIGTAVNNAECILSRVSAYPDIQEITKKRLFEVLDILIEYGANIEKWFNQTFFDVANKKYYFETKQVMPDGTDNMESIRIVMKEYFK